MLVKRPKRKAPAIFCFPDSLKIKLNPWHWYNVFKLDVIRRRREQYQSKRSFFIWVQVETTLPSIYSPVESRVWLIVVGKKTKEKSNLLFTRILWKSSWILINAVAPNLGRLQRWSKAFQFGRPTSMYRCIYIRLLQSEWDQYWWWQYCEGS